ncbi:helix-turn-helix domain-containing protein [Streptomyces sp. NPDC051644]|uniref:helix-turn-helix domain-containing protein n=1 Tax=Streptomyces sp. NPDC051644 TaxID=3365666 RepID=UPI00379D5260
MEHKNLQTSSIADDSALLTVREAALKLRISKWKLYDLIRSRLLETIKIGRRRLIPVEAIDTYIQRTSREYMA